ncbi:MAG: PilC/PilY family type IV pilus protein, partial [Thermodesulfobacteriota bacterium]|nr:PilC/PilY family type IV pilus protein [Thermodesulfobacteriota bacterium]
PSVSSSPDDTEGVNKTKIISYLGLDRVLDVRSKDSSAFWTWSNYDYTMMPYNNSIPVNAYTAVTGKATPLAATLENAKNYFISYIEGDPGNPDDGDQQTLIGCRENNVLLFTDGLETCDGDPVAKAQELFELKYRPGTADEVDTPVKVYVVGLGLDDESKAALNNIASAGGTTQAYFADNLPDLISVLSFVFEQFTAGNYTRSNPVVSKDGDRLYIGYFNLPGWKGHLLGYEIDEETGAADTLVDWCAGCTTGPPDNESLAGDAAGSLIEQTTRTVYTALYSGGDLVLNDFNYSNATALFTPLAPGDINNDTNTDITDAQIVISFTLDPGYDGGSYKGARTADWKLGDIYHSTPVVVGPPSFGTSENNYPAFKTAHEDRSRYIYVGANDGMLHVFDNDSGEEVWAYIPNHFLPDLKGLSEASHQLYMDGTITAADIYSADGGTVFDAPPDPDTAGEGWHTVLVTGERGGGNYYIAIDITDPDSPAPLWEITDTAMGNTWSTPEFGKVNDGGDDKYVVFVGGGLSDTDNIGNSFYIINIEEGDILKEFSKETSPDSEIGSATNNIPSQPRAVQNSAGYIDTIYIGDLEGKLYKFDLSSTNTNQWDHSLFFDPGAADVFSGATVVPSGATLPVEAAALRRPIYYPPAVVKDSTGHTFIFYGTGDEQDITDATDQDFFAELEDLGGSGSRCNWIYKLPVGEKMLGRPVAFSGVVYFTTYQSSTVCGSGSGYLYGLTISAYSGGNPQGGGEAGLEYDADGTAQDPKIEKTGLGGGVPSAPEVTNGMIYVTSSFGNTKSIKIPGITGTLRSWREVY